jgi:uncharacterized membrane protein
MKTKLTNLAEQLRASLWFLPTVLLTGAFALGLGMVRLDETLKIQGSSLPWIYQGGPEGARAVLAAIAGSMITVTGVTFSITIVALTLASTQFGPRLLQHFMRDRGNQFVLGIFLATFLYSLLVLRRVNGVDDQRFVPHLSVSLGIVLAILCLGFLIYFIHHAARNIHADQVISLVARDLDCTIDRFYPKTLGKDAEDERTGATEKQSERVAVGEEIVSDRTGYVQAIDGDGLILLAKENNGVVHLKVRPGDYLMTGSRLALVSAPKLDEKFAGKLNATLILGNQRTGEQDVEFAVHQLVEVALRALSPGINDPFTAIQCVDRLGAALARLAGRAMPSPVRRDDTGAARVIAHYDSFAGVTRAAFDQIRQSGRTNASVTIRLLEVIAETGRHTQRDSDRSELLRQATMIERGSREGLPEEEDRKDVRERYAIAVEVLRAARIKA